MSVLLNPGTYGGTPEGWLAAFQRELPDMDIRLWPDVLDLDSVEFVIAVRHDPADLHNYPNLRAVLAMGAGIEQYTGSGMPDVPVVRLAEPFMYDEMAAYVVHWVVHFQKRMDAYLERQATATWRIEPYPTGDQYPIAIVGFGRIGQRIGKALYDLGFPINAWSRTGTTVEWATSYAGYDKLAACLGASAAVVDVLPATAETHNLMNAERFSQCRPGALFINLGRGTTVDEAALLAALDEGRIGNAVLDVTDPEPMEPTNPLWNHPRVRVTPHVAGFTVVEPAARLIAANVRRIIAGEEPYPLVDPTRGY